MPVIRSASQASYLFKHVDWERKMLTLEELKKHVSEGSIDTVVVSIPDMQGRLMGKRFHAKHFIDSACNETHCCNYLLATDLDMTPVEGFHSASWSAGYGDYSMIPDLTTLRLVPWFEKTASVFCDLVDHEDHKSISVSPRSILKRQLERLRHSGFSANFATELEFFIFKESYEQARAMRYEAITPKSEYNQDYNIFQTAKEESFLSTIRNGLFDSGIKVESTKGEADAGQVEINILYDDALKTADNHVFIKNAIKEMAFINGKSVTFLAKWNQAAAGSSCHIHQSLLSGDKTASFFDAGAGHGMSPIMEHYLAGLIECSSDLMFFMAPYINSYKRFVRNTFAPITSHWSIDNRTAGFRLVDPNKTSIRIENRIGGADLNPYLAMAAQIAAGLHGIEKQIELPEACEGNAYEGSDSRKLPKTLRQAIISLENSEMLRHAMGDEVINHYVRVAEWEQESYDNVVTGYEVSRGFEMS